MHTSPDLTFIIQQFFPDLNPVIEKYGHGHIHDSYRVSDTGNPQNAYLLQRINTSVFENPQQLMDNIAAVSQHLKNKEPHAVNLQVIPCHNGDLFLQHESGCWRLFKFIRNTVSYQSAPGLEHVRQAGLVTGRFIANLADFPIEQLSVTIPDFHNTPKRFLDLQSSIEHASLDRRSKAQNSIRFIQKRVNKSGILWNALQIRVIPWRVSHNDTKLENILFDLNSEKAVCLVDLDTVMPGSALFDFGDALRDMANSAAEDEPNPSKVHFQIPVFETYCQGFLESTAAILSRAEVDLLHLAPWVITLENAMRFLSDYLQNDRYYSTDSADHNLVRCKTQLKLVSEMEKEITTLKTIVLQVYQGLK